MKPYHKQICRVSSEAEDRLTLAVAVNLDLVAPDIENGTITLFEVYLGTVDARSLGETPSFAAVPNNVRIYQLEYYHTVS